MPPKKAMSTSHSVGEERASSSEPASRRGLMAKYSAETARLMPVATSRLNAERLMRAKSYTAML